VEASPLDDRDERLQPRRIQFHDDQSSIEHDCAFYVIAARL
jgi:hypothetical protein